MALTQELHDLVRCVSDAVSRSQMVALEGEPPITGHGYYDPGAIAATSTITWLATHRDQWTKGDLIDILAEMVQAMARKDWAYLPGGPKHGG